jgi:Zn-dependent protease
MRDPLSWSIPLFRAFGIQVRLHILYIVLTLGFILREYNRSPDTWVESTIIWVVVLFFIILLHEFGHCFAARREGGDAEEILMWPLGGLAYCDIPHTARANFVTAAGGPLVNVLICVACTIVLIPFELLPPLNPLNYMQIYEPQLHNWSDGNTYFKTGKDAYVIKDTNETIDLRQIDFIYTHKDGDKPEEVYVKLSGKKLAVAVARVDTGNHYNVVVLWTARVFWMSWVLFLFNLIPAFPLDGGRLLQSLIWGRSGDYRRGTLIAVYTGFVICLLFMVVAFWIVDVVLIGLAIFIWVSCRQQFVALEMSENESVFGYDFSQGYTSLEKDEPPQPKQKKLGPIKRWLQARRERKALRDAEQKALDEARMDELLDKIHRHGKESLSDEERRFMDRVSARYRNRS